MSLSTSHKRALSSGDTSITKKANTQSIQQPTQYVYVTISIRKITHGYGPDGGIETVTRYHEAYQAPEDASNALRHMANQDFHSLDWDSTETHDGCLQLFRPEADDEDYDDNEDVELKVERVRLMPAGCMQEVRLLKVSGFWN